MTNYGKMRGNVRPSEIELTPKSVLVATNITPYEEEIDGRTFSGFEYDYIEYSMEEYLLKLTLENADLKQQIIDTQLALVELYEGGDML